MSYLSRRYVQIVLDATHLGENDVGHSLYDDQLRWKCSLNLRIWVWKASLGGMYCGREIILG